MDFLSGSESVQVYVVCLYMLEIQLTSLHNHATLGPAFPTPRELVLFCVVACDEWLTITVYSLFYSYTLKTTQ